MGKGAPGKGAPGVGVLTVGPLAVGVLAEGPLAEGPRQPVIRGRLVPRVAGNQWTGKSGDHAEHDRGR